MGKALRKALQGVLAALIMTAGILVGTPVMADTDQQKIETVKAMFDAWNKLDWERAINLFSEDGVLHSVMMEPIKGRAAVGDRLRLLAKGTQKLNLQVKNLGVINGVVFAERVDDFVYNGNHGQVPVVGVLKVEGGKVTEWKEYYDHNQLATAMGVAKQ